MSMMLLSLALALQAAPQDDAPADWPCATALIEQRYREDIDKHLLAKRIREKCARPYRAGPDPIEEARRYGRHVTMLLDFEESIENRIMIRRRGGPPIAPRSAPGSAPPPPAPAARS